MYIYIYISHPLPKAMPHQASLADSSGPLGGAATLLRFERPNPHGGGGSGPLTAPGPMVAAVLIVHCTNNT